MPQAKDIMTKDIATLSFSHTLKEVIDLFFKENISGVPVLNEDHTVAGVLTEKEIINVGLPQYMSMMDNISFLKEFEPFEEIFKKVMGQKEHRPFDKDQKRDGSYNFIHNAYVSDAMVAVRELIEEKELLIESLHEAEKTAYDRGREDERESI